MRIERWFDAVSHCQQSGQGYVLVTVLSIAGSTPRETGAKMVLTDAEQFDTIGGGHLEHMATAKARELLAGGQSQQHIEKYPLSSKLGQCCGGAVNLLFEVMVSHGQHLALFGAGHVAKELVPILARLPLRIHWVDERADQFPSELPAGVSADVSDDPVASLKALPAHTWVLIMTHNHQLDFDLVHAALKRKDIGYVGMIGSDTKARRFQTRLAHRELATQDIERLISPVGITDIPGKQPIEVAVSIAGQLIQQLHADSGNAGSAATSSKALWQSTQAIVTNDQ